MKKPIKVMHIITRMIIGGRRSERRVGAGESEQGAGLCKPKQPVDLDGSNGNARTACFGKLWSNIIKSELRIHAQRELRLNSRQGVI